LRKKAAISSHLYSSAAPSGVLPLSHFALIFAPCFGEIQLPDESGFAHGPAGAFVFAIHVCAAFDHLYRIAPLRGCVIRHFLWSHFFVTCTPANVTKVTTTTQSI
jgi:hypothetical protein